MRVRNTRLTVVGFNIPVYSIEASGGRGKKSKGIQRTEKNNNSLLFLLGPILVFDQSFWSPSSGFFRKKISSSAQYRQRGVRTIIIDSGVSESSIITLQITAAFRDYGGGIACRTIPSEKVKSPKLTPTMYIYADIGKTETEERKKGSL